jgi:hypothetical protein
MDLMLMRFDAAADGMLIWIRCFDAAAAEANSMLLLLMWIRCCC